MILFCRRVNYFIFFCILFFLPFYFSSVPRVSAEELSRPDIEDIIHDYLLENPDVLREALINLRQYEEQAQQEEGRRLIQEHAELLYRSGQDPIIGNPEGRITLVEFFDYNCGYCKRSLKDVLSLLQEEKDLKIILKEFPILGESSVLASRAALASVNQGKYWDFHVALMELSGGPLTESRIMETARSVGIDTDRLLQDMASPMIDTIISENRTLASSLGIRGTPAFTVGDDLLPGALGLSSLQSYISSWRDKGCSFC